MGDTPRGWLVIREWIGPALIAFGAALTVASQLLRADATTEGWQNLWLGVAIAGALLAAGTPFVDKRVRERREATVEQRLLDATTEQLLVLNDALDPVVEELGRITETNPGDLDAALGQLKSLALIAATKVTAAERARGCYFEAEVDPDSGKISVVPRLHAGRRGKSRTTFVEGTSAGDAVIDMLKEDYYVLCMDHEEEAPSGWDKSKTRDYRTFISVPVRADRRVYGMLTVDAPEAGSLSVTDVAMLKIIGNLIGIAEGVTERRKDTA